MVWMRFGLSSGGLQPCKCEGATCPVSSEEEPQKDRSQIRRLVHASGGHLEWDSMFCGWWELVCFGETSLAVTSPFSSALPHVPTDTWM